MKKRNYKLSYVILLCTAMTLSTTQNTVGANKANEELTTVGTGNPYLPLWEHLPDGEPRVFEDPDNPGKYRAYIVGSHDVRFNSYCGADIRMWSAPVAPHSRGCNRKAMVCKGNRPDGPFTPINQSEDGTRTLHGSILGFAPSIFVENLTL